MPEHPDQTEIWMQRAMAGDRQAIEEMINGYRTYLRKLIDLRMGQELRVRVDPSDIVQETQMVAAQRMDDFLKRRPTTFKIWLRRKALEQLVDMRRRHVQAAKRTVRKEVHLSSETSMAVARGALPGTPSMQLRKKEQADLVRDAIDLLSETDREILLLRHVEELTNAEVAEILNIGPATASQRYGRALRRLRETLVKAGVSYGS